MRSPSSSSSLFPADYMDTMLAYLDQNLLADNISLRVLCQPPSRDRVRLLASQCPGVVSFDCKHEGVTNTVLWTLALEALMAEKGDKERAAGGRDQDLQPRGAGGDAARVRGVRAEERNDLYI